MDAEPEEYVEVEATPAIDEADADLEAWTPEDFDHFTDIGPLRTLTWAR